LVQRKVNAVFWKEGREAELFVPDIVDVRSVADEMIKNSLLSTVLNVGKRPLPIEAI
jgi:hypothetical protein